MTLPFPLIDDLPAVELRAMALDGEVYPLAEGFLSVATRATPELRALAARGGRSTRLIAALGTAAWVWGAADAAPSRGEYLVDIRHRWRPSPGHRLTIIESVVHEGDIVDWGHSAVTAPKRTLVDIARFRDTFTEHDRVVLSRLAQRAHLGRAELEEMMDRAPRLASMRRARDRIRQVFSPS